MAETKEEEIIRTGILSLPIMNEDLTKTLSCLPALRLLEHPMRLNTDLGVAYAHLGKLHVLLALALGASEPEDSMTKEILHLTREIDNTHDLIERLKNA